MQVGYGREGGSYYSEFFPIGINILEGKYLVLTIDIETGKYWFDTKTKPWIIPNDTSHWNVSMKSQFSYVDLQMEDEYIWMYANTNQPKPQNRANRKYKYDFWGRRNMAGETIQKTINSQFMRKAMIGRDEEVIADGKL